jgi:hypothetical protein
MSNLKHDFYLGNIAIQFVIYIDGIKIFIRNFVTVDQSLQG